MTIPTNELQRYYPPKDKWRLGLLRSALDPYFQVYADEEFVIIRDTTPKSLHHYLMLPRKAIDNVTDLTIEDLPMLESMILKSKLFAEEQIKPHSKFPVAFGFHVIPSFVRLHLHIVSTDFQGPGMKSFPDYRSFTDLNLWMPPQTAIEILKQYGKIAIDKVVAERVKWDKTEPLRCLWCPQVFFDVPSAQAHALIHEPEFLRKASIEKWVWNRSKL